MSKLTNKILKEAIFAPEEDPNDKYLDDQDNDVKITDEVDAVLDKILARYPGVTTDWVGGSSEHQSNGDWVWSAPIGVGNSQKLDEHFEDIVASAIKRTFPNQETNVEWDSSENLLYISLTTTGTDRF